MTSLAAAPLQASGRPARLRAGLKTSYGAGCVIDGVSTTALTYFSLFYFTAVCGLSASLAGLAVFLGLIVDSVMDPLIGFASDGTRSRLGRRHIYMIGSLAPLCLAFGLLFSIPKFSGAALFAYVTALSISTRVLLSMFNLPYYALGAELTDDYEERMSVVAYRFSFLMLASFVCLALGLGVFFHGPQGLTGRDGYAAFGWTCALAMLAGGAVSWFGTRRLVPDLRQPGPSHGRALPRIYREAREVLGNRSFVILFIASLTFFIAQGTSGALSIYANKYFWRLSDADTRLVLICITLGPVIGVPLTGLAARKFEKRALATAGLAVFALALAATPLLKLAGLLPSAGLGLTTILVLNALIVGAALTCTAVSFQAMIADAADEHELLFGVRREGTFFAGLTLAVKAASGVGALVAGVALDVIRFPTAQVAAGLNISPPVQVVRALGLVAGPLPAVIAILAPLVLLKYHLSSAKVAEIQARVRSGMSSISKDKR